MKRYLIPAAMLLTPAMTFAQSTTSLEDFFTTIINLINNTLIPVVIAIAVLVFIWGVFMYVLAKSDDAKEKGRDYMIYGIIGLFVMISVWGLVNLLGGTFNLDTTSPDFPEIR